jgi:diguanylate cyclase (GGDEF)-like protein
LEENLAWEIERIKRSRDELSLIIFDIDHFKMVNDTHGHDVGDKVLKEVVAVVSGAIRQSDTLYRIGGEEFVILTPYTNRQQAAVLAEKVRAGIENHRFEIIGKVTVSMGCAQLDKKGDDGTRMLKRADQAMYHAKESGRNRVCLEEAA